MKKKLIAGMLAACVIMLLGAVAVQAQIRPRRWRPVHDGHVLVLCDATAGDEEYDLRLVWTAPESSTADVEATNIWRDPDFPNDTPYYYLDDPGWSQFARRFDFEIINRTLGQQDLIETVYSEWDSFRRGPGEEHEGEIAPGTEMELRLPNLQLDHSSLYEINIVPHHNTPHFIPPVDIPPAPVVPRDWEIRPANEATGATVKPHRSIVFLTDIRVHNAIPSGDEITVEWFNPQWNGLSVIEHWQIMLIEQGTNRQIPIEISALQAETFLLDGRAMLRYTVSNPALTIGRSYRVRVEPMVLTATGRVTLRSQSNPRLTGIPDAAYANAFVAFRGMSFRYEYEQIIPLVPQLNINVEGANSVLLYWAAIAPGAVGHIRVEYWNEPIPDPQTLPPASLDNTANTITTIPGHHSQSITQWFVGLVNERRMFTLALFDTSGNFLARSNPVYHFPGLADFSPYSPILGPIDVLTNNDGDFASLGLTWRAFTRAPYNEAEEDRLSESPHRFFYDLPADKPFIDLELEYQVFISDSWENIYSPTGARPGFEPNYVIENPMPAMLLPPVVDPIDPGVPMFRMDGFSTYTTLEDNRWVENRAILPNNVYYVRIEAVRRIEVEGEDILFVSTPSFGIVYIPPDGDMVITPGMIDAPPLRGNAGTDAEADTFTPMITLNWPSRYVAILDPATVPTHMNRWHASAGLWRNQPDDNGPSTYELFFGRTGERMPADIMYNWSSLNDMLTEMRRAELLAGTVQDIPNFLSFARDDIENHLIKDITPPPVFLPIIPRIQDVSGSRFRIHVVSLDEMMARAVGENPTLEQAFDQYLNNRLLNGNNIRFLNEGGLWQSIGTGQAGTVTGTSRHSFTAFNGDNLAPNTAYVVFFQPYIITGAAGNTTEVLLAHYPNYVIVTTPDEFIPAIPRPTTPVLFPGAPPTDTTVGVQWRVQGGGGDIEERLVHYEIRWSEVMMDYPTGGALITWEELLEEYSTPGARLTEWFNPSAGVNYYRLRIDNLFPDTAHYIWARAYVYIDGEREYSYWSNPIDIRTRDIAPPQLPGLGLAGRSFLEAYNLENDTNYTPVESNAFNLFLSRIIPDHRYLPRATTGEGTGGDVSLLELPRLPDEIYAIRFDGLLPNRDYFIRARTILTITRGVTGNGTSNRQYSYEIQLADNEEFIDPVIFYVPPLVEFDERNMRRAISVDWRPMQLSTLPSGDDYDSPFRPEQFPLPEYDWEITYDDGTLLWRFRTDRIGADGRPDQQADQRFITRLTNSRVHRYEIDLSHYPRRPEWPVIQRELMVPLSILRAFSERLITLDIKFGDFTISFPPGALDTAAVRGLNMGMDSFIRIAMETNPPGVPALPMNTRLSVFPQRLTVEAVTPQRRIVLQEFARPLEVTVARDDLMAPGGLDNISLFSTTPQLGAWQDAAGLRGQFHQSRTFAAITRENPQTTADTHPSFPAMQRVTAQLNISDMLEYNPNITVSAAAFNNIINAVANNQRTVNTGGALSSASRHTLEQARLLAPANPTWEVAADILVRLYELRSRREIVPMHTPQTLPGIDSVTPALQNSILKAAHIGFVSGHLQPHRALTMGDLMVMLDIIFTDTGY